MAARAPPRRSRGARRYFLRRRTGGIRRDHRRERIGQEHAAQGDRRRYDAHRGKRPCVRPGRIAAGTRRRVSPHAHRPRKRLPERRHSRHAPCPGRRHLRRHRRVLRHRQIHRLSPRHLFEWDARPPRFRRRRLHQSRHLPGGRGTRRRRRRVSAPLPLAHRRTDGAGQDDCLRIARPVDREHAVQARNPAQPGADDPARHGQQGHRLLPAANRPPGRPRHAPAGQARSHLLRRPHQRFLRSGRSDERGGDPASLLLHGPVARAVGGRVGCAREQRHRVPRRRRVPPAGPSGRLHAQYRLEPADPERRAHPEPALQAGRVGTTLRLLDRVPALGL